MDSGFIRRHLAMPSPTLAEPRRADLEQRVEEVLRATLARKPLPAPYGTDIHHASLMAAAAAGKERSFAAIQDAFAQSLTTQVVSLEPIRIVAYLSHRIVPTLKWDGKCLQVHFADYEHPRELPHLRLACAPLEAGWIRLDRARLTGLVFAKLRTLHALQLPETPPAWVAQRLAGPIKLLKSHEAENPAPLTPHAAALRPEFFPPCMQALLHQVESGSPMGHAARFALVTFLHRRGVSNEQLLRLFQRLPGFHEGLTQYQIEHITKTRIGQPADPRAGYTTPSCAKLREADLCPDSACDGANPLEKHARILRESRPGMVGNAGRGRP